MPELVPELVRERVRVPELVPELVRERVREPELVSHRQR